MDCIALLMGLARSWSLLNMIGVETPSTCDDFTQARARMREAVHASAAPLRPVAERLHAAVTERGWSVTMDDMGRVIYLMDDLTRRTDDILSPDADDDSFDEDNDMFIRRVRHDLRNPIGAMAGYLELSIEEA
jgi:signal transduction histidine kinase